MDIPGDRVAARRLPAAACLLVALFALALVARPGAQAEGAGAAPSPAGRTYQVTVVGFGIFRDCFRFGADGSFHSVQFGPGAWEETSSGSGYSAWRAFAGSPLIGADLFGVTFPRDGRLLVASGTYVLDPFIYAVAAWGFENPFCRARPVGEPGGPPGD